MLQCNAASSVYYSNYNVNKMTCVCVYMHIADNYNNHNCVLQIKKFFKNTNLHDDHQNNLKKNQRSCDQVYKETESMFIKIY